ncbi:MAG: GFA family protein [Rhizobiales bacterium]|nr:GFA family protein [Hyphomicrobiales bacterium]
MKIDGQCHCGAITYEAEVDPEHTTICHCADCQTLSGTVFRTSIRADGDKFRMLKGEPKVYVKTGDSGAKRAQAFCANCGSPIYATAAEGDGPKIYNIRAGTVRQRDQFVPKLQIWCRSEQQWLPRLGSIRKLEKQS